MWKQLQSNKLLHVSQFKFELNWIKLLFQSAEVHLVQITSGAGKFVLKDLYEQILNCWSQNRDF